MEVRHPEAARPWQHVMEPLSGYVILAERLFNERKPFAEAWNFGPNEEDARPVSWILSHLAHLVPGARWCHVGNAQLHEARYLKLDSSKARRALGWRPQWELEKALQKTVDWHNAWMAGKDMRDLTLAQINDHQKTMAKASFASGAS